VSDLTQPWWLSALCAQTDADVFFPEKGQSAHAAKRICMKCTVRAECSAEVLSRSEEHGVYAGMVKSERRRARGEVAA
jgi:WhiB family redox-sensing transcriptional regulator